MNKVIELNKLQYSESMQPLDFTEVNDLPICTTWQAICDELNINVGNASARVKLEQAIRQASKPIKQSDNLQVGNSLDLFPKQAQPANNDLAATIAAAVGMYLKPQEQVINESAIIDLINQHSQPAIDKNEIVELIKQFAPVKSIEVCINGNATIIEGAQHEKFEDIVKMMSAGLHLYLYGEAGTGKTHLAEQAAAALSKRYFAISVCSQSTKSDLLGFMSATGQYITTGFREAYEGGGVFLIDEIDNGNPNILAVLNSALANGMCAFPDGMIKRHEDFICIAAANTFGTGANRMYVGRNQLDAATLNRFVQFEIGYDEKLEVQIFGEVAKKIHKIRAKLSKERVIISMRNILNTCKLISVGYTEKQAIEYAVINTIPENLKSLVS